MIRHHGRIERTASKRWRGSVRRVTSAIVYNLSCFTHGCSTGWVSGVLGEQALAEGAWLAALPCLVAVPAAPLFAVLADARGRKAAAFVVAVSFIMSCFLLAWCGSRGLWAARAAAGAGGAGALALAPIYCAEIAPRTRGIAAMPAFTCSCGILFAYGAGGVLSTHALSLSMAVPPIVLLLSLVWLPETPAFLINVGRIQDAAKVMCWFEGSDFREDTTDVVEEQEVRIRTSEPYNRRDTVRRQNSDTYQPMLKRISGADSNPERKTDSACRELFRHSRTRRTLMTCMMLLTAAAGSGAGAITSYSSAIIRHSGHTAWQDNANNYTVVNSTPRAFFETSKAGSMLCGTALVLGAAVATVTLDKFGRKVLLIWSCSSIACCLALLGAYCDPRLRLQSWYHNQKDHHRNWPKRGIKNSLEYPSNLNYKSESSINILEKSDGTSEIDLVPNVRYNFDSLNVSDGNLTEIVKNFEKNFTYNEDFISEELVNVSKDIKREIEISKTEDEERMKTLWPQTVILSMVLFSYNIGLGSVPNVIVTELFSINVRSLASSIILSWMWLTNFLTLRYYRTIAVSLGLHSVYYISASTTLTTSIYIYFCIPETKGKSQKEIDESLQASLLKKEER